MLGSVHLKCEWESARVKQFYFFSLHLTAIQGRTYRVPRPKIFSKKKKLKIKILLHNFLNFLTLSLQNFLFSIWPFYFYKLWSATAAILHHKCSYIWIAIMIINYSCTDVRRWSVFRPLLFLFLFLLLIDLSRSR
jgi:hypothetical protein